MANETKTAWRPCIGCGDCCRSNGAIPPFEVVDGEVGECDLSVPYHLLVAHENLVSMIGDQSRWDPEDHPCVFLASTNGCAIHDNKPAICRGFDCDEQ